jgi:hypothetical protein
MTEANVFEDVSAEKIRKRREERILGILSKVIPGAADWMTEELIFPLYYPTALLKYSMNLVGGPEIISASELNNMVSALEAEEYPEGTGPVTAGAADTAKVVGGMGAGIYIYEAALDKIKKQQPKIYDKLLRAFPYWVDHVHNRGPGVIKNFKGKTGGNKALNFIKGAAKQVKHMAVPSRDILIRGLSNSSNIVKTGTGIGLLSQILTAKSTGDGTIDGPLKNMAALKFSQHYNTNVKPEDVLINDVGYIVLNNENILGELYNKKLIGGDATPSIAYNDIYDIVFGQPASQEELDALTKKLTEEYEAQKERDKNLPLNRKIGESLKFFFEDIGSRKLPQDIKSMAGLPADALKKFSELPIVQSSITSFKEGVSTGENEFDYVVESQPDIIDNAKDLAENERYMQDMMDKTLQPAPFMNNPKLVNNLTADQEISPNISVELNDGTVYPQPMSVGGEPGQFTDSIISGIEEDVNIQDILNQSGFESMADFDIFEEANKKGYQETEVAMGGKLFGKVPMWAVGDVPKPNILTQDLTKNQKKILENIEKKLGTEEEVLKQIEDIDIILDTPTEGTAVGTPKEKKTIIDSPEDAESVFYSGLEARLMDPNTPKTFNSSEDFYKFLQNKQISKKEVVDNILENYIALQKKNGQPLNTADMLRIVRQAPMRKVESVTYGNSAYGGTKDAKYNGYQEPGAKAGSYRESVLYLEPKHIPQDPDSLPGNVHDFTERYVIGWSRLTDRTATLPVEKTPQGIELAVDPTIIRTLKKNQKKLQNQLLGLESSAVRRLEREGLIELDDVDNLTREEMRNVLNEADTMAKLNSIDPALEQQILQFRMKIQEDAARLQGMEATLKGQEITLTFADEIQSDILQQAKQLENKLRESLGSILDMPPEQRLGELARQRVAYSGTAKNVEPEVLEFYTANETIFRPMFNTAEEMQGFVDAFRKNKQAIEVVSKGGPAPSDEAIKAMNKAIALEKKMLKELNIGLSEGALKQLFPNLPFKTRDEWGEALIKRDLAEAAQRLFVDKVDGAATWYAVTPADVVKKRYSQSGGTSTPINQRTKDMKGIGTEEFYGGPDSVDTKGKHYTSTVEKALKRASKENNSEIKIIDVPNVGKVYAIKITPEMLLPHKTHRKKGGLVYTPELIDIFEAA